MATRVPLLKVALRLTKGRAGSQSRPWERGLRAFAVEVLVVETLAQNVPIVF